MCRWVHEKVLWLNVSVANTQGVNVGECAETLIGVKLYKQHGHWLLHLVVVFQNTVYGLRNVVHDNVEINFILLVALSVKSMSQGDNIRMKQFLHYLQFTILVPLVLVHFLNSNDITSL